MTLSIAKLEQIIEAACKDGFFYDGYLYEYEPEVSRKLMADRKVLLDAAEKVLSRMVKHSPSAILLAAAIEEAHAGWPKEPSESSKT